MKNRTKTTLLITLVAALAGCASEISPQLREQLAQGYASHWNDPDVRRLAPFMYPERCDPCADCADEGDVQAAVEEALAGQ